MPKAVVITPTYNRGDNGLLRKTMLSVSGQTYEDFVHLIIDDGSTDNTVEVVRRLSGSDSRIVYIRKEREPGQKFGASAASNYGINIVLTQFPCVEYATFLHSDDMFAERSLEKKVNAMERGYLAVYSYNGICDDKMRLRYTVKWPSLKEPKEIVSRLKERNMPFPYHTLMLKRSLLEDTGGFDENLGYGEDKDFSIRVMELLENGQVCYLPELLNFYRTHDDTVTAVYTKEGWHETDMDYLNKKNGGCHTYSSGYIYRLAKILQAHAGKNQKLPESGEKYHREGHNQRKRLFHRPFYRAD
ncbi:MAG: glycosyltransferase [Candidatus Aenigmarchaeota archaeon]|nr:glycosyltransferase [Candidatus Aenigmarchaeota archaeon]MDI6722510.1 glycosyltransferase [Candidatus Aenigmarchaeota archaeon]